MGQNLTPHNHYHPKADQHKVRKNIKEWIKKIYKLQLQRKNKLSIRIQENC